MLKWTNKIPTVEGFYWVRRKETDNMRVIEVAYVGGGLFSYSDLDNVHNYLWSDKPIDPPVDCFKFGDYVQCGEVKGIFVKYVSEDDNKVLILEQKTHTFGVYDKCMKINKEEVIEFQFGDKVHAKKLGEDTWVEGVYIYYCKELNCHVVLNNIKTVDVVYCDKCEK